MDAAIDLPARHSVTVVSEAQERVGDQPRVATDLALLLQARSVDQAELQGLVVASTENWSWLGEGVGVRRRQAGGESRMKESYKGRPSQSPWPRVMRAAGQSAGRSVRRGTTGQCMELRKHPCVVADPVLTGGRHES